MFLVSWECLRLENHIVVVSDDDLTYILEEEKTTFRNLAAKDFKCSFDGFNVDLISKDFTLSGLVCGP